MFKEIIENRMKAKGIKQTQLAEALGLSRQVVKYKIDNDSFSRLELISLKDLVGLTDAEILERDNINSLTMQALKDFTEAEGVTLDQDDEVYLWHWYDDDGAEHVRINSRNHRPEGVLCRVGSLLDIADWWESEWDSEY